MQLLGIDEVREYNFLLVLDVLNVVEGKGNLLRVTTSHPNYEPCSTEALNHAPLKHLFLV